MKLTSISILVVISFFLGCSQMRCDADEPGWTVKKIKPLDLSKFSIQTKGKKPAIEWKLKGEYKMPYYKEVGDLSYDAYPVITNNGDAYMLVAWQGNGRDEGRKYVFDTKLLIFKLKDSEFNLIHETDLEGYINDPIIAVNKNGDICWVWKGKWGGINEDRILFVGIKDGKCGPVGKLKERFTSTCYSKSYDIIVDNNGDFHIEGDNGSSYSYDYGAEKEEDKSKPLTHDGAVFAGADDFLVLKLDIENGLFSKEFAYREGAQVKGVFDSNNNLHVISQGGKDRTTEEIEKSFDNEKDGCLWRNIVFSTNDKKVTKELRHREGITLPSGPLRRLRIDKNDQIHIVYQYSKPRTSIFYAKISDNFTKMTAPVLVYNSEKVNDDAIDLIIANDKQVMCWTEGRYETSDPNLDQDSNKPFHGYFMATVNINGEWSGVTELKMDYKCSDDGEFYIAWVNDRLLLAVINSGEEVKSEEKRSPYYPNSFIQVYEGLITK